jgi:TetR/AcrR family transcriptional repressor of nem operon
MTSPTPDPNPSPARTKLLDAALRILREKGYNATTVDDLCAAAAVTKGAFFHHFKSKEDMAIAAAGRWSAVTGEVFADAGYHDHADPLDRVLGYIELRASLIRGAAAEFSCLAGTLTQETFLSHPAIRQACSDSITGHAAILEADLAGAIQIYRPACGPTAHGLAIHIQAVLQGAFILAKATDDPEVAVDSVLHLKRYIELLFTPEKAERHAA